MKAILRFYLKIGEFLNLENFNDKTIQLSVGNQRQYNPLSGYCKGDYILMLRCFDSGKYCHGLCGFEYGLHNFLIGVTMGNLFTLSTFLNKTNSKDLKSVCEG